MSISKTILIGNLGKDPEIRTTNNGKRIASFSLATTKNWKNANGEEQSKTAWHNIVIYQEGLVGVVEKYTKRGSKVYLEGEIDYQEYEKDGQKKYITKITANIIQLLDKRGDSQEAHTEAKAVVEELDDAIPDFAQEVPF